MKIIISLFIDSFVGDFVENKVINFGTKSRALSGNLQQLLPLLLLLAMFLICFWFVKLFDPCD